jgi:hypothetical protein
LAFSFASRNVYHKLVLVVYPFKDTICILF